MTNAVDFANIVNRLVPNNVLGDILEFGVWKGRSIIELAEVCPQRAIIGFDHFKGLGKTTKNLPVYNGQVCWQEGSFDNPGFRETLKTLDAYSNIRIVLSDICSLAAPKMYQIENIIAVNIDTDIYEPARAALEFVSQCYWKNVLIRFDDWHANNPEFDLHERLAFKEWTEKYSYPYDLLEDDYTCIAQVRREPCLPM